MTSSPWIFFFLHIVIPQLVKKSNICRNDKTPCLIRRPKCMTSKGHSRNFHSPQNLERHLWQKHSKDRNDYPQNNLVVQVLNEITIALHLGIPLTKIPLAISWKMVIK